VSAQGGHAVVEAQVVRGLCDSGLGRVSGHHQTRCRVGTLQDKASTQDLIAFAIGGLIEGGVNFEKGFFVPHCDFNALTILQQKEVAQRWCWRVSKTTFPVRDPNICGAANGFFRSVVEVVSEGWSYLRFELHCQYELAFGYDDEVPFLFGPVIAWQFKRGPRFDIELA